MMHVEGILRQMGGLFFRCDELGRPHEGHPFEVGGDAMRLSGQAVPVHQEAIDMVRGPYRFRIKQCGEVTYITSGGCHWVREGRFEDFEGAVFKRAEATTTV